MKIAFKILKIIGRTLIEAFDIVFIILTIALGIITAIIGSIIGIIVCGGLITSIIGIAIICMSINFGFKTCFIDSIKLYIECKSNGDMFFLNTKELKMG